MKPRLRNFISAARQLFQRAQVAAEVEARSNDVFDKMEFQVPLADRPAFTADAIRNRADLIDAIENRGLKVLMRDDTTGEEWVYNPCEPGKPIAVEEVDEVIFEPEEPLSSKQDLRNWAVPDDAKPN